MMRCDEAMGLLVSGEIDEEARAGLEEHLRSCAACARDADRVREAFRVLTSDAGDPHDPGPVYWNAFGRRLRDRIVLSKRRSRLRTLLPLAAAAALVVGLAVVLYRPEVREHPSALAGRTAPALTIPAGPVEGEAEAVLRRAVSEDEGRREIEAILDEVAPGDPLELEDALGTLSSEDSERLTKEL
jgi:anti-sigma factor RsiW